MNRRRWLRAGMWVLAIGAFLAIAIISFTHIYATGRRYNGSVLDSMLLPAMADITMLTGELMLLHEADRKGSRFIWGWVIFFFGLASALAANAAFGWRAGQIGGVITWTAAPVALSLIAVGMVSIVKRADQRAGEVSGAANPLVGKLSTPVPTSSEEAAEALLRTTLAAGNPVSVNALKTNFGLSLKTAKDIHRRVTSPPPELALAAPPPELAAPPAELALAGSNGHAAANGQTPG